MNGGRRENWQWLPPFKQGERVRIAAGPFEGFDAVVESVDPQKGTVRLTVTIFGRPTPIEIEYWQIEQL